MKTRAFTAIGGAPGTRPACSNWLRPNAGPVPGDPPALPGGARRHESGVFLIDCLVYLGLFFVVLGVSFTFFYICWDGSLSLRRNTEDITRALNIGEAWRADVRKANAPLRIENSTDVQLLRIPQYSGEVQYKFSEGSLWRRSDATSLWQQLLPRVKTSRMEPDKRRQVTAWRWEMELSTQRQSLQVHPVFAFEAVPNAAAKP